MAKEPVVYPLTLGQQIMYVSQKFSVKKTIVNICTMLHFDCEMDPILLQQAVSLGVLRNQSSRVRLHKQGKVIVQYLSQAAPERIYVEDFSDRTQPELEKAINRWSRIPFPNHSMDTQLYSLRLVHEPNGRYGLFFCVSHLAFDAYTLMSMANDTLQIYSALKNGTAVPKSKSNYLRMVDSEIASEGTDKHQKILDYYEKIVFAEEPHYTNVEPAKNRKSKKRQYGQLVNPLYSDSYHVNLRLDAETVASVNRMAAELHVSPQCFYLLAVRSYLSRVNDNEEDVMIMNTVARRATLLAKRAGGTRVLAIPLRMKFDHSTDNIRDTLEKMSAMQAECYAHSDVLCTDVIGEPFARRFGKGILDGYHSVSVTYNPYFVTLPEGIKAHMTTHSTGAASMPVYLSIIALDNSGELVFNYDCMKYFTTEKTAENIHNQIKKALGFILEHPEAKLQELNNL